MHCKILHGFSLMEALVSLLLLSFILLIFNASGWSILRETRVDYYFHLASLQFKNIEERLRATKRYAGFEDQVALWQEEIKTLLPQGYGSVIGQYPHYTITIIWGNFSGSCTQNQIGPSGCLTESISL